MSAMAWRSFRKFLTPEQVAELRGEIRALHSRGPGFQAGGDARTMEADGVTVRNLWRLEEHNPKLRAYSPRAPGSARLIGRLVRGEPVLAAVETFNKPARVGSGVPYHQDNAYFCQTPPDVLTVWIAIDAVTEANGPVTYIKGSHRLGMLPTKPSGVRGNSIGMAGAAGHAAGGTISRRSWLPGDMHHSSLQYHSPLRGQQDGSFPARFPAGLSRPPYEDRPGAESRLHRSRHRHTPRMKRTSLILTPPSSDFSAANLLRERRMCSSPSTMNPSRVAR